MEEGSVHVCILYYISIVYRMKNKEKINGTSKSKNKICEVLIND